MKVVILVLMGFEMFAQVPIEGQVYYMQEPHNSIEACEAEAYRAMEYLKKNLPNKSYNYICKEVVFEAPSQKI